MTKRWAKVGSFVLVSLLGLFVAGEARADYTAVTHPNASTSVVTITEVQSPDLFQITRTQTSISLTARDNDIGVVRSCSITSADPSFPQMGAVIDMFSNQDVRHYRPVLTFTYSAGTCTAFSASIYR